LSHEDGVERLRVGHPSGEENAATHAVPRVDTFEGGAGFLGANVGVSFRLDLHEDLTFSFGGDVYRRSARVNGAELLLAVAVFYPSGLALGITHSDTLDRTEQRHTWQVSGDDGRLRNDGRGDGGTVLAEIWADDGEGHGGSSSAGEDMDYFNGTVPEYVLPSPAAALHQLVRTFASANGLPFHELIALQGAPHPGPLEEPVSQALTTATDGGGFDQAIDRLTPTGPVGGVDSTVTERLTRPPSD
jgi:hypothetical protein